MVYPQLSFYLLQKNNRIRSVSAGNCTEIIENKPFETQDEKGQYTMKIHHVEEKVPGKKKSLKIPLLKKKTQILI